MSSSSLNINNDNQLIDWIQSRRTIGNLAEPMPSPQQIRQAIGCALTAPDHKKLAPWHFYQISGKDRDEFGKVLAQASANAGKSEQAQQKQLKAPLRAPLIIVCVTTYRQHDKVPFFEQQLAMGAAIQNLLLAFQAQGFNTIWRTGLLSNAPEVKKAFAAGEHDEIAGFIYVGSSTVEMPTREQINIDDYLSVWNNGEI